MADHEADIAAVLSRVDELAARDVAAAARAALVLGRRSSPAATDARWRLAGSEHVELRAAAAAALHQAGGPDLARLTTWLEGEPDAGVAALVADVIGRAPAGTVPPRAIAALRARTALGVPPWSRAAAAWALSVHDRGAGVTTALAILDEPVVGAFLAAWVAARGGPLAPVVDGMVIDQALDLAAPVLAAAGGRDG
jgi:hypothetical protein